MEDSPASRPPRRPRPKRRPERQQIMLRRGLALGAGLLILILIVLGVRGCLDARKDRALRDYATDVAQIVDETDQTSKSFFGKLSDPGSLSVTEFVAEVQADRSAMDNYLSRIDGLDAPGDMGEAQEALELAYALRGNAMAEIAEKMSTALGDVGAEKATASIARQVRKLMASDVLYASVVRPEMEAALADNGIEEEVPESVFVPDDTKWLDESEVADALGQVSGATGAASPGIHGLGLIAANLNGTELSEEAPISVSGEETPELEVEVQNQGESTENGVTVSVTVSGGNTLQEEIPTIAAGETATVTIPLVPTPKGEATLEVEAEPVPGEQVSDNNGATYTVSFE
ncbi:MAG TPA: CARDB domain-containing protein [Solirubrobacterales bacterium]|nr:CARDB domain-containing protein [Solirubrobacterales bacterium]